jgi:hypothetical protein
MEAAPLTDTVASHFALRIYNGAEYTIFIEHPPMGCLPEIPVIRKILARVFWAMRDVGVEFTTTMLPAFGN